MKILLHMGEVKTGTTALQQSLYDTAKVLRTRGVFYPRFGGTAIAHHWLLPLCEDPNRLPPWSLQDMGGPEAAADGAWEAWNATCDAALADPPDLLVLSSELLVHQTGGPAKARLVGILSELSPDITPILYVRDPVAHYRARLQEWLKVESRPLPPIRLNLREAILEIEAAFPNPLHLLTFDRTSLIGGDIVADFGSRFLQSYLPVSDLPAREANVGLSAEALVLLARLRAEGGYTQPAARRGARLIRPLGALDRSDPPARPFTLLPEVADAALRAATCHRWLAETGRLPQPGLAIDRIDGAEVPDWLMTALPETLFLHDPDRLQRLWRSLEATHPHLLRD